MSDAVKAVVTIVAFAVLSTAHLLIAIGLLAKKPRWRAAAALLVPPLAPLLAMRTGAHVRAAVWIVAAATYAAALAFASR